MVFDRFMQKTSIAAAAGALIGSLALAALSPSPARAAEDTNMFNSVLGFVGLQFDKESESIDYRARAPLVLPPKMDLPPPQNASTRRPADWPVDPDVVRRRKEQADSHRPAPQITPNTRAELTKEQLMANRGESVVVDEKPDSDGCTAFAGTSMCIGSPWQYVSQKMGMSKKEDEKVVLSGQEPPRRYLTEPPPGYRIPTATTRVVNDRVKAEPDAADAGAYTRHEQQHRHSVDDN
jgi:hypothetical protein